MKKKFAVAYMGPPGSFTHQAAMKHFGGSYEFRAKESISDVFAAVAEGETEFGVVPVENSNEGAVSHTLDMFIDTDVNICAEVFLDIHHHLMSRSAIEDITTVYSNPMAFAQCRRWLAANLPRARKIDVYSTGHAAELAAKDNGTGAVAAELAADMYGLKIAARAIEDYAQNTTRFFVIGRKTAERARNSKTSLLFSIKDRVGALYDALKPFSAAKINLTKIESRPSKLKAWEYYFFVDLAGHRSERKVEAALRELEEHCNFVKVLGSYPDRSKI